MSPEIHKRDSAATKERILEAARAEFAEFGIAGARVDRIANVAGVNKNMLYIYFGNKEGLFEATYLAAIDELLNTVDLDGTDLPGYAGALFDHMDSHPASSRLARWYALEQPVTAAAFPGNLTGRPRKLAAIEQAQESGVVNPAIAAEELLSLVVTIAATWSAGSPEAVITPNEEDTRRRRQAAVTTVSLLAAPR